MVPLHGLGPDDVRRALIAFRDALEEHEGAINRLNVYPVPDSDTGTNLRLTMESVVDQIQEPGDMEDLCRRMALGSLMGARGVSGVILSQFLGTLADRFSTVDVIDAAILGDGLGAAAQAGAAAVLHPVEGTILTVARESAEAAHDAVAAGEPLAATLARARSAAAAALARTPDLLPPLKQAGVVDAGGSGYLLFLDALLFVVAGVPLPPAPEDSGGGVAFPGYGEAGEHRFEVVLVLEAPVAEIEAFRQTWERLGNDSTVVVGGGGLWVCHVHTHNPQEAVAAAWAAGRPRDVRVTDLVEQVARLQEGDGAGPVVAVASGLGLEERFRAMGALVVPGGRTMNPSTAMLANAVEHSRAPSVIILPNDAKVVLVASQVRDLVAKDVEVVEARSAVQGLAALAAFDEAASFEVNTAAMRAAAAGVRYGEVTRAVRDAGSDAGPIHEGDWIGITPAGVVAVESTLEAVLWATITALLDDRAVRVTLVEGSDAVDEVTESVVARLLDLGHEIEVEVIAGGQRLHPYQVGVGTVA